MASTEPSCAICRRQFSKYTCPTCNVAYCSLTCFRSQAHSKCSETFYKNELESDIRAQPSKTAQERQRMLELLKRFEEESAAQEEPEPEDEDFSRRFQGLDLESAPPDQLWSLLTPAERDNFLKAMADPSSELAVQLLASEDLENEKQEPWWTVPALPGSRYGIPPEPISVPPSLQSSHRSGPSLIYNICALCIAYAYITHHLSVSPLSTAPDPEADAARTLFSQLTPFLTSRTSKLWHPTLDSAITDVHSRLPPNTATPQLFVLLLRDAAALLRPALVVDVDATEAGLGPHAQTLRALGDLHTLFRARTHVAHKLTFYAAFLNDDAKTAALELEREAKTRELELDLRADNVEWEHLGANGRQVNIVEVG
ncbi:hypothetical protein GGX14DRAFT_441896 [Mycena pura]|uniref:HIT-type domain-containing protein n=1 Tax=Mycena pura TaxID=153505 RepID=A0AAD6VQ72_9AGAR|nr:hypothetical protein GGX14DRAFT_441896 [Mycena pura]